MKNWIAILAISKNGVIGKGDSLPWSIPEERDFFRATVSGKTILLGRKTFESLKKVDVHSKYLILTRNHDYKVELDNCEVIHDMETVIERYSDKELWICGGKEVYLKCIKECNQVIISYIEKEYDGEVTFDIPDEDLIWVKDIKIADQFTTKIYINRRYYPHSRFSCQEELNKAYRMYAQGAVDGVAGHHVNYPVLINNTGKVETFLETIKNTDSKTFNIYIHWPFCLLPNRMSKCDFCMCNTKNTKEDLDLKDEYFKSIIKEINMYAYVLGNKKVGNVYIGGGTPLTMNVDMLDQVFTVINSLFKRSSNTLFSIESRPELLSNEKLKILAKHGVNKISLGVESFNNDLAYEMGRIKDGEDYFEIVYSGIERIRNAGIEYLNIDLLYGHPNEKEEYIDETIKKVLLLNADTISFYCMGLPAGCTNIEKNAKYVGKWKSIEYRKRQYEKIDLAFRNHGYKQIVESIWAKVDDDKKKIFEYPNGLNNTCYLCTDLWLGIGVGSFGYIENLGQTVNCNNLQKYIDTVNNNEFPIEVIQNLTLEAQIRTDIIIGILHGYIDKELFVQKYLVMPEQLFPEEFNLLLENNEIEINEKEIMLNQKALNKMEGLCRLFFDKENEAQYRKFEARRVDYKFYNVSYEDLE